VNKIHRITGQIGQLIGKRVPLLVKEPAYTHTKPLEKRVDMLAKVTKDTRARAGAGIGAITNADSGSFQITSPNSTESSESGSYDTRTIEMAITRVMAMTFRVE
jgi:hypothetical protein